MRHQVVFLDQATLGADLRPLRFEHDFVAHAWTLPGETVARIGGATIAITNKVRIDRATLAAAPHLEMIAVAATGVDILDLAACAERRIVVSNVRSYGPQSVAEHTLMFALALRRKLMPLVSQVAGGAWARSPSFCLLGEEIHDLAGSTFGVIGAGAIGRRAADLAQAFGMRALFAERRGADRVREGRHAFEEVLTSSDVLSLHCPLDASTRSLIGRAELDRMKPGAALINTARGALVDEDALAEALEAGRIGGAAVDVLPVEPPPEGKSALIALAASGRANLIVTPHVGWASEESRATLLEQLARNIEAFVAGEPRNVVVLDSAARPA